MRIFLFPFLFPFYRAHRLVTGRDFFGLDGRPTVSRQEGGARVTWTYDAFGRRTGWVYWGPGGKPMRHPRRGYHRNTIRFDREGNVSGATFFDEEGEEVRPAVVLFAVRPGTPAARLRLLPGDVLLAYDGRQLANTADLQRALRSVADSLRLRPLQVRRFGLPLTFQVTPARFQEMLLEDVVPRRR
jgi:YD repeat-containing protein